MVVLIILQEGKLHYRVEMGEKKLNKLEGDKFLEQLKESGFTNNFFLALTPQSQFWSNYSRKDTIYEKFRKEKELYGTIKNQIGDNKEEVTLKGRHKINWLTINDSTRYFVMRI